MKLTKKEQYALEIIRKSLRGVWNMTMTDDFYALALKLEKKKKVLFCRLRDGSYMVVASET